jgi:hypothetical protein
VRLAVELILSKDEQLRLEKQEKQLRIVQEEIKALQDAHLKAVL